MKGSIRDASPPLHVRPLKHSLPSSQTNQSLFIKLLQSAFRIYNCNWVISAQKSNIESCIKTLADVGKFFCPDRFSCLSTVSVTCSAALLAHQLSPITTPSCFHPAKARAIAIPVDLDSQVNTLSLKVHSNMVQRAAKDWRISARTRPRKEPLGGPDYKNIIEKLQVLNYRCNHES